MGFGPSGGRGEGVLYPRYLAAWLSGCRAAAAAGADGRSDQLIRTRCSGLSVLASRDMSVHASVRPAAVLRIQCPVFRVVLPAGPVSHICQRLFAVR